MQSNVEKYQKLKKKYCTVSCTWGVGVEVFVGGTEYNK